VLLSENLLATQQLKGSSWQHSSKKWLPIATVSNSGEKSTDTHWHCIWWWRVALATASFKLVSSGFSSRPCYTCNNTHTQSGCVAQDAATLDWLTVTQIETAINSSIFMTTVMIIWRQCVYICEKSKRNSMSRATWPIARRWSSILWHQQKHERMCCMVCLFTPTIRCSNNLYCLGDRGKCVWTTCQRRQSTVQQLWLNPLSPIANPMPVPLCHRVTVQSKITSTTEK